MNRKLDYRDDVPSLGHAVKPERQLLDELDKLLTSLFHTDHAASDRADEVIARTDAWGVVFSLLLALRDARRERLASL